VWSSDGRSLAYAADGVWLYDVASGQRTRLTDEGEPLAWSDDGEQLLVRGKGGVPIVARFAARGEAGTTTKLPIDPVGDAGWLPGRPVAWLVDPGLRMLMSDDTPMLATMLGRSVPTTGGFARPDDWFLVLADRGAGLQLHMVDLADPRLAIIADGPPLAIPSDSSFVWAPDGRHGAVAGRDGLKLLDPATGAQVPLVGEPSRSPQWVPPTD
jgi:hypothetical protein